MLCVNPDKFVVNPDGSMKLMQGLIAEYYERELGGRVLWFGKPVKETYVDGVREIKENISLDSESTESNAGNSDSNKKRILMIGDAFETDVQGVANANGTPAGTRGPANVDSLMIVNTGIHYEKDLKELGRDWTVGDIVELGDKKFGGLKPTFVAERCGW